MTVTLFLSLQFTLTMPFILVFKEFFYHYGTLQEIKMRLIILCNFSDSFQAENENE